MSPLGRDTPGGSKQGNAATKKDGLSKLALRVGALTIGQFVVGILYSIALARYAGVETFGAIQFATAWIAGWQLLYSNLDFGLLRFFPSADPTRRVAIFGAAWFLQWSGTVLGVLALLLIAGLWQLGGLRDLPGKLEPLTLVVLGLQTLLTGPQNTLRRLMQSLGQESVAAWLGLGSTVTTIVAILCAERLEWPLAIGLPVIFGTFLVSTIGSMLIGWRQIFIWWPEGAREFMPHWRSLRHGFDLEVRAYVLPLQGTALTSYLKEYLPTILVGATAGMTAVAGYRVLQQTYSTVHKAVPQVLRQLIPSMVRRQSDDPAEFERKFFRASCRYVVAIALVSVVLQAGCGVLLNVWGIQVDPTLRWVALMLGGANIVGAASQADLQLLMLGRETRIVMASSIARQIVGDALSLLLIKPLGMVGAAVGFFAGTLLVWASFGRAVIVGKLRERRQSFKLMLLAVALVVTLGLIGTAINFWHIGS